MKHLASAPRAYVVFILFLCQFAGCAHREGSRVPELPVSRSVTCDLLVTNVDPGTYSLELLTEHLRGEGRILAHHWTIVRSKPASNAEVFPGGNPTQIKFSGGGILVLNIDVVAVTGAVGRCRKRVRIDQSGH